MIDPLIILSACVAVWLAIMIFIESWRYQHEYLRSHLVVIGRRHYLFLVEECCIGESMNACEMLLLVAVVVVIAVDVYREIKNEMAWFLFPDCCDCYYHDCANLIGERMNAIDIMLIVCTVALFIVGVIINVWQWFLNHGYMHVVSSYRFLRIKVKQWRSYSIGWKY